MMTYQRRIVREENGDLYLEQGKFKFPFSPPVYEDDTVNAYNTMYYVGTENVESNIERKITVRKNINSTIDPRKI